MCEGNKRGFKIEGTKGSEDEILNKKNEGEEREREREMYNFVNVSEEWPIVQ